MHERGHASPQIVTSDLKSCYVLQDHYDDKRDKIVFHKTTPDLQDQDRFLLVSGRSCSKTDGLRPHH